MERAPVLFRIATFNVEWFFTKAPFAELELCSVPEKAARLAKAIAEIGPLDALALQEVQSEAELSVLCQELERLVKWRPKYVCGKFASVRTGQRVSWLYNVDTVQLSASGTYDFESYELLEKNLWLDVLWNGVDLRMVCLHMKANFDEPSTALREREAKALAHQLSKFEGPLIVTGDFNDFDLTIDPNPVLRSSVLSTVRASCGGLETAASKQEGRSSTVYGVLIDHILVNKYWRVESCVIHKSRDTQEQAVKDRTSDHFPVSARLSQKQ